MNEQNAVVLAITQAQPQFVRIAQQHQLVRWPEELQFALQAVKKNTVLQKCRPESVQDAIINVAAVGLTLNPADGYAYLVPEYVKATKTYACQLRISFRGLIKIATDTGSIKWVKAEIVKENDEFKYRGPCDMPLHGMDPFGDRGPTVGVYCVAKTSEDDILVDIMAQGEIEQIKSCAKTTSVWDKWPDEMAKKAIIKRAQKQWPKTKTSTALHAAVDVINQTEGSDYDELEKIQEIASYVLDHIEKDDQLAVGEAWAETTTREKELLWVAKTKGGYFSIADKEYIRASRQAYYDATTSEEEKQANKEEREKVLGNT